MNLLLALVITLFILIFLIAIIFALDEKNGGRPLKDRVFYFVVALVFAVMLSVLLSSVGILRLW